VGAVLQGPQNPEYGLVAARSYSSAAAGAKGCGFVAISAWRISQRSHWASTFWTPCAWRCASAAIEVRLVGAHGIEGIVSASPITKCHGVCDERSGGVTWNGKDGSKVDAGACDFILGSTSHTFKLLGLSPPVVPKCPYLQLPLPL
jgi:hypothetical protein